MRVEWRWRLIVLGGIAAMTGLGAMQGPLAPREIAAAVREYRATHEQPIVKELVDLLAIPNIASDEPNIRRNAEQLKSMLGRRGMRVQLFEIPKRGPIVYAELSAPGAARTLVFYAHYDGQPVDPKAWTAER
jgi:acetylornithine deacetylase/succinyl-diaminopimelate desuccinylase-like protein